MRIVSLNAWGGAVWPALSDWIAQAQFDVLCLQEVTRGIADSGTWLEYRDPYRVLQQRADLFGDVSALLPGWQASFAPAARGALVNPEGEDVPSEHGLACWVAPPLAVTGRRQGFVHGCFRPDGWGEEPVPRAIQSSRVQGQGKAVWITHFHGLRDPSGKGDTPERVKQAQAVLDHMEGCEAGPELHVLAGDFNVLPDGQTIRTLTGAGLVDLVTTRGHSDTRTHLYEKPGRYANYCLVSDIGRVAAFSVPPEPVLSDHRMLVLDIAD